jgi:adenylate cyclase
MTKLGTGRKLTTIIAADAVGFSEMMSRDENQTLNTLKSCQRIIFDSIEENDGRVFGGAGDSVIAEFSSPVQAVVCANEFQQRLAKRNRKNPEQQRMWFRVGINLGDVMVDGDNLYGDGVNIAARLEQIGEPGGICVSAKVFEEVKRNLDLPFVDGGVRELKNIAASVTVYHMREVTKDNSAIPDGQNGNRLKPPLPSAPAIRSHEQPSIAVHPFEVTGDEDTKFLAEGLRTGLIGILSRYTGNKLVVDEEHSEERPDYILEASVRGRGGRYRLSFGLIDTVANSQVWNKQYDRQGSDAFELEDEISQAVTSALRIKLKALAFEGLRNTDNKDLSVAELLNKAAGYFVISPGSNDEIEEILTLAINTSPDNPMALSMMAGCILRRLEHSPLELPEDSEQKVRRSVARALELNPDGYFSRLMAAYTAQDLDGDFAKSLVHAQAALESNPNFTQALAVVAICKCHLGQSGEGLDELTQAINANLEDPQRFRNNRELAIALFVADKIQEALGVSTRLVELAPELERNKLVHMALLWHAGEHDGANEIANELMKKFPSLNAKTMRPIRFGASDAKARFYKAFQALGFDTEGNLVALKK